MDVKPIPFDEDRACDEGWGLFDATDGYGAPRYEICCEDMEEKFSDDLEARAFVLNSAMDGSQYHRDALAIVLGLYTPQTTQAAPAASMSLTEAQTALDEWGLNVLTRSSLMAVDFEVSAYSGATSMTPAEIEESHAAVRAEWRERVRQYPGAYVIYDPNGDAEDWMLVGDDLAAIVKETLDHHAEIRA